MERDDAAGTRDEIRRIQDAAAVYFIAVCRGMKLIVRPTRDDLRFDRWNRLAIEHTAQRTRRENVTVRGMNLHRRGYRRAESPGTFERIVTNVRDDDMGAFLEEILGDDRPDV